jgi:hypothetical protein
VVNVHRRYDQNWENQPKNYEILRLIFWEMLRYKRGTQQHGPNNPFNPSMILLNQIVFIFALSDLNPGGLFSI